MYLYIHTYYTCIYTYMYNHVYMHVCDDRIMCIRAMAPELYFTAGNTLDVAVHTFIHTQYYTYQGQWEIVSFLLQKGIKAIVQYNQLHCI